VDRIKIEEYAEGLYLCDYFRIHKGNGYKRPYMATDKEELYGTWVNMDYGSGEGTYHKKIIINPDGTEEYFSSAALERASWKHRYLIDNFQEIADSKVSGHR
jgi:hypothetical protein